MSNSPLEEDGNFSNRQLPITAVQKIHCESLGLHDFDQGVCRIESAFRDLAAQHPEYPKCLSTSVSRRGDINAFSTTIALHRSASGVRRPNGSNFFQNMKNSFLPERPASLTVRQIRVLGKYLLLGISSGTDEDYRILQEQLACSTQIQFTVHWAPEPRNDSERRDPNRRSLDLKISY